MLTIPTTDPGFAEQLPDFNIYIITLLYDNIDAVHTLWVDILDLSWKKVFYL